MYRNNRLPLSLFWIQGLCFILGTVILVSAQTTITPQRDDICESLKNHTAGGNVNVLAVGLRKRSLILVTKDWMVYDVPESLFNSTSHQLTLYNPEHIQYKYPALWYNSDFQEIQDTLTDGIVVMDKEKELLCFVAPDSMVVIFDLDSHSISLGWYLDEQKNMIFISTPKSRKFHATQNGANGIEIDTWELNQDRVIHEIDYFRSICWTNKSQEIIIKQPENGCEVHEKPVQWPVMKGFVAYDSFYLFDEDEIHVFAYDALKGPNSSATPVINVKYGNFFWCLGNFRAAQEPSIWLITFSTMLIVILLCLIIISLEMVTRTRSRMMPNSVADQPDGLKTEIKLG